MRRFLAALFLAAAAASAFVLGGASDEGSKGATYKIQFDNAFGLVEQGDFRIGGVTAGTTSAFEVVKVDGRAVAEVEVEVKEPGFADLRRDAACEIRPQSLIGEYYVDCQPGQSPEKLPTDGTGVVPFDQNFPTIPPDLVNDIMRRPVRERFRLILSELGTGLAGRPQDLAEALERAHPGLRETSRVLKILGDQNDVIERFIVDADTVVQELEQNKKDVGRWVTASADSAEVTASRHNELAASFHKLPAFLDELRPTMHALGRTADEQTPLLVDLRKAAPELNEFFERLGPFSEASLPAIESLGDSSKAGTEAFAHGSEEVEELLELSKDAGGFAKPLRQFLETMDDRKRALENDPRAKATAPPEPDPTAIPDDANFRGLAPKGGFTGLEGLWDCFYWQTLSINMADDVGHIVRLGLTVSPGGCSQIRNSPPEPGNAEDKALFEKCNQYIGPHQPGVNEPDFTIEGVKNPDPITGGGEPDNPSGARKAERREPGQLEAPPIPGRPDPSVPKVTLPPLIRELLKQLDPKRVPDDLRQRVPQIPDPQAGPETLLDFLLAP
jgi:phospholipid/cholesterol/gamma-HCH transport system substrate-binding protein